MMKEQVTKRGRPGKFSEETQTRILKSVEAGMPLYLAANAAGISYPSLHSYRQKHSAFAEAIARAISRGVEKRLEVITQSLESKDANLRFRAATWFLEHTQPEHFAKTRIQIEAVGQLEHSLVIPQQTLNEIAEARARQKNQNEPKQIEVTAA